MSDFLKNLKGYDAKLQRFDVGQGFYVEIAVSSDELEACLAHKYYGVKELMFSREFTGRPEELFEFGCTALKYAHWYFRDYFRRYTDGDDD